MLKDSKCAICGGNLIENSSFDSDNDNEVTINLSCMSCEADISYKVDTSSNPCNCDECKFRSETCLCALSSNEQDCPLNSINIVYIAGSITNDPKYKEHFLDMEILLRDLGFTPLNPVKNLGFNYRDYIDMGLCELMKCDTICMLNGYENSKGAMLELAYANTVGMNIIYEKHLRDIMKTKEKL